MPAAHGDCSPGVALDVVGDISARSGAFGAVGDRGSVPVRVDGTHPAAHCAHHVTRGTGGDEVGAALHSRMYPRRRLGPVTAGTDTCQEKTSDEEARGDKQ